MSKMFMDITALDDHESPDAFPQVILKTDINKMRIV